LEAIREIKKTYPQVKILVLTMHKKKEFIRQALGDGADGFLLKEDAGGELLRAVQTIKNGGKYLSPLLAGVLANLALEKEPAEVLTVREREVLKLLAEGRKTKEIAAALYISPYTVRRHRANIMEKLEIKTLADLVKYAISHSYLLDQ
jgi:DNA-binding NarL/FixJ family response regulator